MRIARVVFSTLSAASLALATSAAWSQQYPVKPIRIVTPGLGGSADFAARLIGIGLTDSLGKQVIVDNRPNGPIPGEIVSKAPPDGYTLLISANSLWMGPLMEEHVSYDPIRDFSPITNAARSPNVLLLNPSVPANTVRELIALAKAKPGALNYGTGATGSGSHLAAELLKSMASVNMMRIPYKSNSIEVADLIGGQIQFMFSNAAAASAHIKSGRLKGLAVTSAQTSALFPELPTVAATVPGYELVTNNVVFAPAKTPVALINRLNHEIVRYLKQQDVKDKFMIAGMEVIGDSPESVLVSMKGELSRWAQVIKSAKLRAE